MHEQLSRVLALVMNLEMLLFESLHLEVFQVVGIHSAQHRLLVKDLFIADLFHGIFRCAMNRTKSTQCQDPGVIRVLHVELVQKIGLRGVCHRRALLVGTSLAALAIEQVEVIRCTALCTLSTKPRVLFAVLSRNRTCALWPSVVTQLDHLFHDWILLLLAQVPLGVRLAYHLVDCLFVQSFTIIL